MTGKQLTPIGQICVALDKMEGSLHESLKDTGVTVGRFLATAKTAVQTHADKDKLARADRQSLYLAVKKAAGDGLMPDGREAALVVYNVKKKINGGEQWVPEVQYQPMVQGLVKLARKSGEIEDIGAYVVYEKDSFTFKAGSHKIPEHEANGDDGLGWFSESRGNPIGVWAFVKLKSGEYTKPTMLSRERIMRIAKRSKMGKNYDPQQGLDWEEFWCKAAIRNALKYAPRSTALDRALDAEEEEYDFEEDNTVVEDAVKSEETGRKRKTKAASKIKETATKRKAENKNTTPEPEPEPEIEEEEYDEDGVIDADYEEDESLNEDIDEDDIPQL